MWELEGGKDEREGGNEGYYSMAVYCMAVSVVFKSMSLGQTDSTEV